MRTRVYGAIRLENGNTLIASGSGKSVVEVTPEKKVVWKVKDKVPGTDIGLGWMTCLQELGNGNRVVGNCHAGEKIRSSSRSLGTRRSLGNLMNGNWSATVWPAGRFSMMKSPLSFVKSSPRKGSKFCCPEEVRIIPFLYVPNVLFRLLLHLVGILSVSFLDILGDVRGQSGWE